MQTQWSVIIEILNRITDLQFQKEVWIEHKHKHLLFSYGETVNTLDDYYFFNAIKERELDIDNKKYQLIEQYIKSLIDYQEPANTSLMLTDPKWLRIIEETKEIINILETNTRPEDNESKYLYSFNKE